MCHPFGGLLVRFFTTILANAFAYFINCLTPYSSFFAFLEKNLFVKVFSFSNRIAIGTYKGGFVFWFRYANGFDESIF